MRVNILTFIIYSLTTNKVIYHVKLAYFCSLYTTHDLI